MSTYIGNNLEDRLEALCLSQFQLDTSPQATPGKSF